MMRMMMMMIVLVGTTVVPSEHYWCTTLRSTWRTRMWNGGCVNFATMPTPTSS